MSDYIKREDALDMHFSEALHEDMVLYVRYAEVKEHLQNVSSADVVEVVRCKDCKYWGNEQICKMHSDLTFGFMVGTEDNDYCSCGEKKDEL